MDIIYTIGSESTWDNNELRYSLRSLEMYGRNYDRVFVVGDIPKFLSDNVIKVPYKETSNNPEYNNISKVYFVMKNYNLNDYVCFMQDDIIFQKEYDFKEPIWTYTHEIFNYISDDDFYKMLVRTRNKLIENDKTIYECVTHHPFYYKLSEIENVKELLDSNSDLHNFSYYVNMNNITPVISYNAKFNNIAELNENIPIISLSENMSNEDMYNYLKKYNNKGKYEI